MFASERSRPRPGVQTAGAHMGCWGPVLPLLAAILLLTVLMPPAKAQTGVSQLDQLCSERETNVAYKACLRRYFIGVDRELNRVWKQVIAAIRRNDYLEPKLRKKWERRLREAQRNWVRFKEIDCNDAVGYEWWGGSGAGSAISFCLIRHTILRTENLKERYISNR